MHQLYMLRLSKCVTGIVFIVHICFHNQDMTLFDLLEGPASELTLKLKINWMLLWSWITSISSTLSSTISLPGVAFSSAQVLLDMVLVIAILLRWIRKLHRFNLWSCFAHCWVLSTLFEKHNRYIYSYISHGQVYSAIFKELLVCCFYFGLIIKFWQEEL